MPLNNLNSSPLAVYGGATISGNLTVNGAGTHAFAGPLKQGSGTAPGFGGTYTTAPTIYAAPPSGEAGLGLRTSTGVSAKLFSDGAVWGLWHDASSLHDFVLGGFSSEWLRVSSGNLTVNGTGYHTFAGPLSVDRASDSTQRGWFDGTRGGARKFRLQSDGSATFDTMFQVAAGAAGAETYTEALRLVNASGNVNFGAGGMLFDRSNKRLRIGDSSAPTDTLDVSGSTRLRGKMLISGGSGTETVGGGSGLQLLSGYASPVSGRMIIGDGTGYVLHMAKHNGTTMTDLITFADSGRVGVGTTTPAYALDVAGAIHSTGQIMADYAGARFLAAGSAQGFLLQATAATNYMGVYWDGAGAGEVHAPQTLRLETANTARVTLDANGNVAIGGALTTTATNGYLYIPTMPGAPTGVPTAFSGRAPIVFDTTNNKLWIYNGTWKGVALA